MFKLFCDWRLNVIDSDVKDAFACFLVGRMITMNQSTHKPHDISE